MKVISLLQPWASLVVLGHKKIETRSWNTLYRGDVLIHASSNKKLAQQICEVPGSKYFSDFIRHWTDLSYGAIIGKVTIIDTAKSESIKSISQDIVKSGWAASIDWDQELAFGDFSPKRYGWLLKNPVLFPQPIPAKGSLNLWNYEFEGQDQNHILQCTSCGYAACADAFPIDKHNIDTDEEDWDTWCPKCEEGDLKLIIENLPFFV